MRDKTRIIMFEFGERIFKQPQLYKVIGACFVAAVLLVWFFCWMIAPYGFNPKPLP